jgi:hypothetical protein
MVLKYFFEKEKKIENLDIMRSRVLNRDIRSYVTLHVLLAKINT